MQIRTGRQWIDTQIDTEIWLPQWYKAICQSYFGGVATWKRLLCLRYVESQGHRKKTALPPGLFETAHDNRKVLVRFWRQTWHVRFSFVEQPSLHFHRSRHWSECCRELAFTPEHDMGPNTNPRWRLISTSSSSTPSSPYHTYIPRLHPINVPHKVS